ncbi:MAG: branched-chain amino acid aminotransferase [Phycisphaerales bacterium]|nr:branched-chain amino acid aminotransferase [Phycisphaerales bacterium]
MIAITKSTNNKLSKYNLLNEPITFGTIFTDHYFEATYANSKWQDAHIKPFTKFSTDPTLSIFHYGQSIFEGLKAFKTHDNKINLFRPYENFKRINRSAERMAMPAIPEEYFIEGAKKLVALDRDWMPNKPNHSLYIRPFMFAADHIVKVRPSDTFQFFIVLSPAGPYHGGNMKILVEDVHTRSAPGGTGSIKNGGNYGCSMLAMKNAMQKGFDQVLWMDAFEHKWIQEVGMMNVFFIINGVVITPALNDGTILPGVTRDSLITIFTKILHLKVEERNIHIDEIIESYKNNTLQEIFGAGTAAVISIIDELKYKDVHIKLNIDEHDDRLYSNRAKKILNDIRLNIMPDTHEWLVPVC